MIQNALLTEGMKRITRDRIVDTNACTIKVPVGIPYLFFFCMNLGKYPSEAAFCIPFEGPIIKVTTIVNAPYAIKIAVIGIAPFIL